MLVKYFAFGSNLDAAQMLRRCPTATPLAIGKLEDHRLAFVGYSENRGGSVATVVPSKGMHVPGLLWSVSAAELERLDRFEGVPHVYCRAEERIKEASSVRRHRAFVYAHRSAEESPPDYCYLALIRRAYLNHGFDSSTLPAPAAPPPPPPAVQPKPWGLRAVPKKRRPVERIGGAVGEQLELLPNDLLMVAAGRVGLTLPGGQRLLQRLSSLPPERWALEVARTLGLKVGELDPFLFQVQVDPSYLPRFLSLYGCVPEPLHPG